MRGRAYSDRYLEVRYEDLCENPSGVAGTVFDFLGLPFLPETKEWITASASTRAIGKWMGREEELAGAISVGQPFCASFNTCS